MADPLTYVGSFNPSGAIGSQSVTGVGFQPVAVVFWWGPEVTAADSSLVPAHTCLGVATSSSQQWASRYYASDGTQPYSSLIGDIDATKCLNSVVKGAADFVSFGADGFTINWSLAASASATVYYQAFGGAFVAHAGTFTNNASTDTAVTGVGFTPTALMAVTNDSYAYNQIGVGFSDSTLQQRGQAMGGAILLNFSFTSAGTANIGCIIRTEGELKFFDDHWAVYKVLSYDADGFTTRLAASQGVTSAFTVGYLAFAGCECSVGDQDVGASGVTVSSVGKTPYAGFFMQPGDRGYSNNNAVSVAAGQYGFGGCDISLNQFAEWMSMRIIDVTPIPSEAKTRRGAHSMINTTGGANTDWADVVTVSEVSAWTAAGFVFTNSVALSGSHMAFMLFVTDSFVPQIYRLIKPMSSRPL